MKIDSYGQNLLDLRKKVGRDCLDVVDKVNGLGEDDETNAADAISDILTELYGPAGVYRKDSDGYQRVNDDEAELKANALLDRALGSWLGDAEDYSVEVEL
jgi:hypothetical protein